MDCLNIKSLGELKKSNWVSKSIKDELRDNLISIKKAGKKSFFRNSWIRRNRFT